MGKKGEKKKREKKSGRKKVGEKTGGALSPKPMSRHAVTRNSKRETLRNPAQRTTKKLLKFVSHQTANHCHVFREFLQQVLCQFNGTHSMLSTCTPMQMSSSVCTYKTRISLILNETVFFQFVRQMPPQRLGDVRRPNMALRTFHTTRLHSISFGFRPSSSCPCSCSPSVREWVTS